MILVIVVLVVLLVVQTKVKVISYFLFDRGVVLASGLVVVVVVSHVVNRNFQRPLLLYLEWQQLPHFRFCPNYQFLVYYFFLQLTYLLFPFSRETFLLRLY